MEQELLALAGVFVFVEAHAEGLKPLREDRVKLQPENFPRLPAEDLFPAPVSRLDGEVLHLLGRGEGVPHRLGRPHPQGAVGPLVDLVGHEGAAPLELVVVVVTFLGGHPPEEDALAVEGEGAAGVIGPAVEGVVLGGQPGAGKAFAHAVDHLAAVAVLRDDVVPPVPDLEQVGHLVHGEKVRGPEVPLELPVLQIFGGELHRPAGLPCLGALEPGA